MKIATKTVLRSDNAPTAAEDEPCRSGLQRERLDAGDDISILIVDDNADVAAALSLLLQLLGCRVITAASGAEALSATQAGPPRMALLDIGLPDIDGLELARRLRRRYPSVDQLRLVAISGYGYDEDRREAFDAGFDEHLTKPVGRDTLQALIARVGAGAA
ncbi:MAG: response regulator [Thiohalocapsa sp.]|nr:response regulator [Thiohalocapsa sp.]